MYNPAHFEEADPEEIQSILQAAPLACIVAQTAQGLVANHIPLFMGPKSTLIGHLALANDMHRQVADGQEVLVIFRGDDVYISPNYYPTKQEHHRHVPTWNYQVVHMYGRIRFQHDAQTKRAAVGLLTRDHEHRVNGENAWRMGDAPEDFMQEKLSQIVALRIEVTKTLAKSKLSQNKDAVDFHSVMTEIEASGPDRLARRMRRLLDS